MLLNWDTGVGGHDAGGRAGAPNGSDRQACVGLEIAVCLGLWHAC